jgi:NAD(P)-dependent dehydrogenase (short-subunit alcohol dehydrogenase family)
MTLSLAHLNNKIILVTGASDGIGKHASLSFAKQGATVILLGRTARKLEQVYDEIVQNGGATPAIIPLDLAQTSLEQHEDIADKIQQEFGRLDGLLHNAAILGQLAPFTEISSQEFNEVMQVNLNSQFFMTQAFIPLLLKADHGSTVFTTSGVGNKGRAFWGSYCISKFATEGMMQLLADEYENRSLRFNCINPGATRTNMRAKAFPGEVAAQVTRPEDIMHCYHYLMSDESIGKTGQTYQAQPKN